MRFNGVQAFGNWTLEVSGGTGPHGGILQSWSLSINAVASKPTSFEVTFDRPIDPQALLNLGEGTFMPADVQVLYHDTNPVSTTDPSIPLMVTSVVPVQPNPTDISDPTQNGVDGYTQFLVYFDPDEQPDGSPSGITRLHRHLQLRDRAGQRRGRQSDRHQSPIMSWSQCPGAARRRSPRRFRPTSRFRPGVQGDRAPSFDYTTSTINLSGFNDQVISNLTVNLNITDPLGNDLGNDGDLAIELTAPNGNYRHPLLQAGRYQPELQQCDVFRSGDAVDPVANGPYDNGTYQPGAACPARRPQRCHHLAASSKPIVRDQWRLSTARTRSRSTISSPSMPGPWLNWSITVDSTKLGPAIAEGRGDGPERRRHVRSEPADHAVHGPDPRRRLCGPDAPAHGAVHVQRHAISSARRSIRTRSP